jgi:phosphoribosylformimino-5-aminoimidazole carboxamide ribotide isomerase
LATISETNSHSRWIAATESMTSTEALSQLAKRISPKRLLLGLDFRAGEFLGPISLPTWGVSALQLGFAGAVVMDLASVGKPTGPTTQSLCQSVKRLAPNWTLFSGGGIQTTDDIASLIDAGCDRCLVATALHCIL